MTHEIDFNEAEKLGWEIAPRFEARKGERVLRGTATELTALIAENEDRERLETERRRHAHREHHDVPISRLLRQLGALEEEHRHEWDKYSDSDNHHSSMFALERATKIRTQQNETLELLFGRPNEVLLAKPDFRGLQEALREPG